MQRYDEDIEVIGGLLGDAYVPVKFCCQDRWWRITDVLTRWVDVSDWSYSDLAVSPRCIGGMTPDGDLFGEEEIWRVVADQISGGSNGVYELSHSWGSGRWRLRAVMD